MELEPQVKSLVTKWAASRRDEVVFNPKEGYYSFEIVHDAYKKGLEQGKDTFIEEFRAKFFEKAQLVGDYLTEMFAYLSEKDFSVFKVFINHNYEHSKVILTIDQDVRHTDEFIYYAYEKAISIQNDAICKELNLSISFIDNVDHLDTELLEADGYTFQHTF